MNNGIYILATAGPNGTEYRIAYSENIESIWGGFDPETVKYKPMPKAIQAIFGECLPMKSATGVKAYAMTMPESKLYLTDGIFTITELEKFTFEELINGC